MPRKKMSPAVGEILARRRISDLKGARKKKYYQISEAVTLFTKGMKRLSKYYPIPRRAIKEFEEAIKQRDVVIEVIPGEYLAKNGRTVTAGEMIYSPSRHAWIIKLPQSAFDEMGNLKSDSLMTLWHELTHVVRSFIPQLEKLPTAYDEATTNFIADRLAELYLAEPVKTKYLNLDHDELYWARLRWRDGLVYKPEMVEGIFGKVNADKLAEKHRARLFREFARGLMLKKKVRGIVSRESEHLRSLKGTNPRLYNIRLVNEARKKLLDNRESLERWSNELSKSALVDAMSRIEQDESGIASYFSSMKKADTKFLKSLSRGRLRDRVKRILTKIRRDKR